MEQPKHINTETLDGSKLNLDALYKIAPSCFTEAKGEDGELHRVVDFNKLRLLLGDDAVEDAPEVYDFTWVGKRAALHEAAAPINKTLRPCPEESVDWDTTQNLYIEGDNLEVLKLLQNSYMGKVKMIYIDPPYNTGNDFVYHDDFSQSSEEYEISTKDENGYKFFKNTEASTKGRFHSSWCSMIYSRLMVARSLLTEDGVIFISIDDNELENLLNIGNEVFGENNHIVTLIWNKQHSQQQGLFKRYHESIVVFARNLSIHKNIGGGSGIIEAGAQKKISKANPESTFSFPAGVRFDAPDGFTLSGTFGESEKTTVVKGVFSAKNGKTTEPVVLSAGWTQKNQMKDFFDGKEVYDSKGQRVIEFFFNSAGKIKCTKERSKITPPSLLPQYGMVSEQSEALAKILGGYYFDSPKPVKMIEDFCKWFVNDGDICLDFFSGSATTAHAVMQLNAEDGGNRKFIMVQLPEETAEDSEAFKAGYKSICEIGKERIRRAGKKIKEESPLTTQDLDIGFRVFKCEDSNFKEVTKAPKDYDQNQLDAFVDNIKEERTDLDLLFDCMLHWGVELSLPLSSSTVDGCTIHNVNEGDLVACFKGLVTEKVIDAIAKMSPVRVVFRDSSFNEAAQKMNLFELFKQKCDWTDEEVRNNVRVI